MITSQIENHWIQTYDPNVVVALEIATKGISRSFPGSKMPKSYDPSFLPWYLRGLAYPGQIAINAPDVAANIGKVRHLHSLEFSLILCCQQVVSISRSIYKGRASGFHLFNDKVTAVMVFLFVLLFGNNVSINPENGLLVCKLH